MNKTPFLYKNEGEYSRYNNRFIFLSKCSLAHPSHTHIVLVFTSTFHNRIAPLSGFIPFIAYTCNHTQPTLTDNKSSQTPHPPFVIMEYNYRMDPIHLLYIGHVKEFICHEVCVCLKYLSMTATIEKFCKFKSVDKILRNAIALGFQVMWFAYSYTCLFGASDVTFLWFFSLHYNMPVAMITASISPNHITLFLLAFQYFYLYTFLLYKVLLFHSIGFNIVSGL